MKQQKYILIFLLVLAVAQGFAKNTEYPFAGDIRKFKTLDSINPPAKNSILFIGSSSFTMWTDVQDYFPGFPIINRGFGGSCLTDLIRYTDDIVVPYHPKQVVIYCGENDFASSDTVTPAMVNQRFGQLFGMIRAKIPEAKITYVSIKPSPSRSHLKDKVIESNKYIRKYLKKQANSSYVDVWNKMLGSDKQPMKEIFLEDQLHMNPSGYAIWQKAIVKHLIK